MSTIIFEKELASANKSLPALPKGIVAWFVEYMWLLAAIGAVVTAVALLSSLSQMFRHTSYLVSTPGASFWMDAHLSSGAYSLFSGITMFIVICLVGGAVKPLKKKLYSGWKLLYVSSLVSAVMGIFIATFATPAYYNSFGGIMSVVVSCAIGLYVLFQIRSAFLPHKDDTKTDKSTKKPTEK